MEKIIDHKKILFFFIGFLLSYFSYRQYYPDLHSPESDIPYSVRLRKMTSEYHKANFNFLDGSQIAITVVKNESKDSINSIDSNSSQAEVPLVV